MNFYASGLFVSISVCPVYGGGWENGSGSSVRNLFKKIVKPYFSIIDARGLVVDFYVASKDMVSYSSNLGKILFSSYNSWGSFYSLWKQFGSRSASVICNCVVDPDSVGLFYDILL
jgi:predicted phosphatase